MFILACGCLIFCLAISWHYWKVYIPYSAFASDFFLFMVLRNILTGKNSKDTRATHVYFQMLIDLLMNHRSEGVHLIWMHRPNLCIFGEESVKVFSNELACINKSPEYEVMKEYFGDGLLTCDRELWFERRKMLNPVFHVAMLKRKVDIINRHAATLVKTLLKEEDKSSLIIIKYLQMCAFDNIYEFVLGMNTDDPKKCQKKKQLIEFAEKSQEFSTYRFMHPWMASKYVLPFFAKGREYLRTLEESFLTLKEILLEIKETIHSRSIGTKSLEEDEDISLRKTFGEIIMEHHLKDPSYTMEHMQFELSTFLAAGYDTVSYALMWCLFTMGHHPEVQQMAFREVEELGKDDISYDDLKELKYLDCVIHETLRLYPVAPLFARKLEKNVQCGKYTVPKGTSIVFVPYVYHRNPELYPDPEEFNPERFRENSPEKRPWTHIAFSTGNRNCIGKKFALMEMKIVLAHILRSFKVTSLDRTEDLQLCWEIVLNNVKPLRMRFTTRQ